VGSRTDGHFLSLSDHLKFVEMMNFAETTLWYWKQRELDWGVRLCVKVIEINRIIHGRSRSARTIGRNAESAKRVSKTQKLA
jgi:hypothetical protein